MITTVAGNGTQAASPGLGDGGPATQALVSPGCMVFDAAGNLYFVDGANFDVRNSSIRKISPAGIISTFVALPDLYSIDLAIDSVGNLYASSNLQIVKIDPSGKSKVIAGTGMYTPEPSGDGGNALNAGFVFNYGLAVDSAGNVYVSDFLRVRKITPQGIYQHFRGRGDHSF